MKKTSTPEKVLIAITKANWGGAQRYVFDIAEAAKKAGLEVVVAYGAPGLMAKKLKESGIRTIELPLLARDVSVGNDYASFKELLLHVKKEAPHTLHLNSSKMGIVGALAGRLSGVPNIVFTAHGWAFNEGRPFWQKGVIALLHYVTVLLSHKTLCNSKATRKDCAWMPFVQHKIHVVRLGVSPISFVGRQEARERLSPGNINAFWIGMVGELHTTKGVFEAIEGFQVVAQTYPDTRLMLMGEGDARLEIEKQIHAHNLDSKVVFLGHVADAPAHMSAFDVFLFPSRTEALGMALLEAGLAGLPAVGTNVGGIPEILEHRKTGLLVPRKNSKCIGEILLILMKDPSLRRRLGEALKHKVETEFSRDEMLQKTIGYYR